MSSPANRYVWAVSFLVAVVIAVSLKAKNDADREAAWLAQGEEILVIPPNSAPPLSQESIDLALLFFGIRVPHGTEHPQFDRDLADRGVTVKPTFFGQNRVSVGPEAFSSWAILGSTLAHELEVHCQQSFLGVWVLDLLGLDGTHFAERVAYLHEINNRKRFGLKVDEEAMIFETLDFYYPESYSASGFPGSLNRMAAKSRDLQAWFQKKMVGP